MPGFASTSKGSRGSSMLASQATISTPHSPVSPSAWKVPQTVSPCTCIGATKAWKASEGATQPGWSGRRRRGVREPGRKDGPDTCGQLRPPLSPVKRSLRSTGRYSGSVRSAFEKSFT
eukprot:scaffold1402_cov254-Pinguiococcus_pyrenoidosus.AAC.13